MSYDLVFWREISPIPKSPDAIYTEILEDKEIEGMSQEDPPKDRDTKIGQLKSQIEFDRLVLKKRQAKYNILVRSTFRKYLNRALEDVSNRVLV